jgi:outer membrane protein assembly factor BamB
MFRGDERHTGFTEKVGRVRGPTQKWRFPTNGLAEPSAAVGDINGDGRTEVVVSSHDGSIYAVDGSAQGLILTPKWEFKTEAPETGKPLVWSSPALGDVDSDGRIEVIVGADDKNVYVLDGANGVEKWRFSTTSRVRASPTLADVDGDGRLEILIASSQIYALDARARRVKWAYRLATTSFSSAAVGDIDGDKQLEVVVGSYDNTVYALSGPTGTLKWKFYAGNSVESSPALGDIDGDGKIEVIFGQGFIAGNNPKGVYALRGTDGARKWFFNLGVDQRVISSPALADIDGDGKIEVVIGSNANKLYVFEGQGDAQGNAKIKYIHETGYYIESSPTLGDIDGDGKIEIVVGSHDAHLYVLEAIPGQQQLRVEWKYSPPSANIFFSSPTLADIDDDGLLEIVIGNNNQVFYAFDGP